MVVTLEPVVPATMLPSAPWLKVSIPTERDKMRSAKS
jgi:hypothetical protein